MKRWDELMDLLGEHRLDEAAALCRRALAHNPDDPSWILGLSWALLGLGHLADALEHARIAAEHDTENAPAFRTVAIILLKMGRLEPALEAAQHAVHLDPDRTSVDLLARIRGRMPAAGDWSEQTSVERVLPVEATDETRAFQLTRAHRPSRPAQAAQPPDAQLAALYGASLFGDWEESLDAAANPGWTRYLAPVLSWRAISLIAILLAIGVLSTGIVTAALRSSRASAREHATAELNRLLRSGAVEQLAELLESPDLPAGGLVRRAHATVYRYHDADPSRLGAGEDTTYDGVIASAVVLARGERMAMLAELARVDEGQDDPQASLLLADTLVSAGDLTGARAALMRANELEPSNILHVATQIELELAAGAATAAQNAAATALDINPYAAWTRIASWRVALSAPEGGELTGAGPVTRAHLGALDALSAAHQGRASVANEHLGRAIGAVTGEPPFLLDWFDLFLAEGQLTLAQQLVQHDAWPETPAGRAGRGRLLAAQGELDAARHTMRLAWSGGVRDVRVAIALHETGDDDALLATARAWPDRLDLRVHVAGGLSTRGELRAAATELDGVPIRKLADPRLISEAFTVQARIAAERGEPKEALRLSRRAVHNDKDNHAARALMESLSSEVSRPSRKKKRRRRNR